MEEIDSIPEKKARAGRRADDGSGTGGIGNADSSTGAAFSGNMKKGGWDTGPTAEQMEAAQREQEKKFEERYFGNDTDTAVAANGLIPALESPLEKEGPDTEDITKVVAEAPRNYNTQVQGLPDLERDGIQQLPNNGDDIDITALYDAAIANTINDDEDIEWLPGALFQQIRSELQGERDAVENKVRHLLTYMSENTISVVSDIDGKRCKLVIKSGLSTLTVANIKKHLVKPTGLPAVEQILTFNGMVLDDSQIGEQIGLHQGAVLRLSSVHAQPSSVIPSKVVPTAGIPAAPPGVPARNSIGAVAAAHHPQYYTPSELSVGAATNQVSTVSRDSHPALQMGRPLPAPDPPSINENILQPDITGRGRQKEAELLSLQRQVNELDVERSIHNQAGINRSILPNPNPSLVDPGMAGYNDMQAAKERIFIENQAVMGDQIAMQRTKLQTMQDNAAERQFRQDRMISGSTAREKELEMQVMQLESQNQLLSNDRAIIQGQTDATSDALKDSLSAAESRLAEQQAEIERMKLQMIEMAEKSLAQPRVLGNGVGGIDVARQMLVEFGRELGVETELDFDENLTCVVGVEQRYTILLTYDQSTERLYVYSTLLTYLPKDPALRLHLYEALLEGALMGREMSGGGVGLSMKCELLLMSTSIDLRHSDTGALRSLAPDFVEALVKWRQTVKQLLVEETNTANPQLPAATIPTPTPSAHGGLPPQLQQYAASPWLIDGLKARGVLPNQ